MALRNRSRVRHIGWAIALQVFLGSALVALHNGAIRSPGVLPSAKPSAAGFGRSSFLATFASEEQASRIQFALCQEVIHRTLGFAFPGVESGSSFSLALAADKSAHAPGWFIHQAAPLGLGPLVLPKHFLCGSLEILLATRWQVVRCLTKGTHCITVCAIFRFLVPVWLGP